MSLHHAILGLLETFGQMSGYDLKQHFSATVSNIWEADLSQIYRSLDRLEVELFVASTPDPTSGRGRKIYAITDNGRAHLHEWVQQDLQLEVIRNPALLQIFFSRHTPPERFRQQILDYRQKFIELASNYDQIETMLIDLIAKGWENAFFQHLTLLLGKHYTRSTIEWCDEVLARLDQYTTSANLTNIGENEHD